MYVRCICAISKAWARSEGRLPVFVRFTGQPMNNRAAGADRAVGVPGGLTVRELLPAMAHVRVAPSRGTGQPRMRPGWAAAVTAWLLLTGKCWGQTSAVVLNFFPCHDPFEADDCTATPHSFYTVI